MLQEETFIQGEDMDIERVVKRAVDVFDAEKNVILSKIMIDKVT